MPSYLHAIIHKQLRQFHNDSIHTQKCTQIYINIFIFNKFTIATQHLCGKVQKHLLEGLGKANFPFRKVHFYLPTIFLRKPTTTCIQ